MMNVEHLATESQQTFKPQPCTDSAAEPNSEITTLPFETFSLIGGGGGVVLD
jgi:hypothetical protein